MVWWLFWWFFAPLRWLGLRAMRRRHGWGHRHPGRFGGYGGPGYGGPGYGGPGFGRRGYGGRWRGW